MSVPAAVRDASTVILLRDREKDDGFEVFMVRRHEGSSFVGGAYVFPGGSVDAGDRVTDWEPVCAGRTDAEASAILGVATGGLAFWVAAVREMFEEAGVLFAYTAGGELVDVSEADVASRFESYRLALNAGDLDLASLARREGLRLAVDRIHYWAHWITPQGAPRRFDTRFFVAAMPAGQDALHDDKELVASAWVTPAEALAHVERGEWEMIFPTIRNLQAIAEHPTSTAVAAAAALRREVPTVVPRVLRDGAGVTVLAPGDPGFESAPPGLSGLAEPPRVKP